MRIVICEDMPEQMKLIKSAVSQYAAERRMDIEIISFENPLMFLESLSKSEGYDIALLDIFMPGISGIDVAKEIRKRKDHTEIIFLTTSDEFALDAFALRAVHYLVKPFTGQEFFEAMDRATERYHASGRKKLAVKTELGEIIVVDADDIYYIESHSHQQTINTADGVRVESRRSMARLYEELEKMAPGQFMIPYKGYIVNNRAIKSIEVKRIIMAGGDMIPIPRGKYNEIKARYFDYMFGGSDDAR